MTNHLRRAVLVSLSATAAAVAIPAFAQKKYDVGATDTTIKIGGISPYSGPASAYGIIGKGLQAYFRMVNDQGGVNGRKIEFISYDDGYNPAKTVEMARKLVEQDEVLFIFNTLGTPPNSAIHKYMNDKKVPQLFVATGAAKWGDPKHFPWTMGWQPSYQSEAKIMAQHMLDTKPNGKIAVIYQNDDFGKDYIIGLEEGLGEKAKTMIVKKLTYEVTDPTVDSQMVELQGSGADIFFDITTPKFAAQVIRRISEIGWKPTHYLSSVSASVGAVINPAGPQNAVGILTTNYLKDPTDTQWHDTPQYKEWLAWMKKYNPDGNLADGSYVYAWNVSQGLMQVLKQAGDTLTRANIMKQAANLDMVPTMVLPGVNVKTAPDDFYPIEREYLQRFDGKTWVVFGKVYGR